MVTTRRTALAATTCLALVAAVTSACLASANDGPPAMPNPGATSAPPTVEPLPPSAPVVPFTVVKRLPHDPTSYTQGLEDVGNGVVLESTGVVGRSHIGLVDVATGTWKKKVAHPIKDAFGEGATIFKGNAYYLTWQHGKAVSLDPTTFVQRKEFTYDGEGWGLTHDDQHLIMSNGSDKIVYRDPATFAETSSFQVTLNGEPLHQLNELEYVKGTLYANIYLDSRIAVINPKNGHVTGMIDTQPLWDEAKAAAQKAGKPLLHGEVPNGIAYLKASNTFLLTGKDWPVSFEVKLDVPRTQ